LPEAVVNLKLEPVSEAGETGFEKVTVMGDVTMTLVALFAGDTAETASGTDAIEIAVSAIESWDKRIAVAVPVASLVSEAASNEFAPALAAPDMPRIK
jgi:hypothetical protein